MKMQCEIIRDLIPLMEDDVCSSQSRQAVLEHIEHCEECRNLYEASKISPVFEMNTEEKATKRVLDKGFKKIKRRWMASILAVLLVIPVIMLSVNQFRGEGVCFTNVDDIYIANRYVNALEKSDWDKMASYMNYDVKYDEIMNDLQLEQSDFEAKFCSFKIADQEWMVREEFYNEHCKEVSSEMDFWMECISKPEPNVIIPLDIWNEILSSQPDYIIKLDEEVYQVNDCEYVPFNCEWGSFMANAFSAVFGCESILDYCMILDLVPIEVYEQGKEALHTEAVEGYEYIQEKYSAVADMTKEEFRDHMKEEYVNQLEQGVNHTFDITSSKYDSAYKDDGEHWVIVYELTLSLQKEDYTVYMHFSVEDGKVINLVGTHYNHQYRNYISEELDELIDALKLSYPE